MNELDIMKTIPLILGVASSLYTLLIYVLPEEKAMKLTKVVNKIKPLKVMLEAMAKTPAGLRSK